MRGWGWGRAVPLVFLLIAIFPDLFLQCGRCRETRREETEREREQTCRANMSVSGQSTRSWRH